VNLVAGALNEIPFSFISKENAQHVYIHMMAQGQLLSRWMISSRMMQPTASRTFMIDIPKGKVTRKVTILVINV
jgi:hypothetical protein